MDEVKKWDDITEKYLKAMPMNFIIRTGVSNAEWYQAIRRVPNGWIFYESTSLKQIVAVFVPEAKNET